MENNLELPKMLGKSVVLNMGRKIYISPIKLCYDQHENPLHWEYTFKETNSAGITHTKQYYSKNLQALTEHRAITVDRYRQFENTLNRGAECQGFEIKPTILQRIMAKNHEKIK